MFWNWFFFILYSLGTVCAISNMRKAEKLGEKIFRMSLATLMFVVSVMYGIMLMITMLGI
jgi:hypothetical protein